MNLQHIIKFKLKDQIVHEWGKGKGVVVNGKKEITLDLIQKIYHNQYRYHQVPV